MIWQNLCFATFHLALKWPSVASELKAKAEIVNWCRYPLSRYECSKWNILEVINPQKCPKGHLALFLKANSNLEKRGKRSKLCMLTEGIYINYVKDIWDHVKDIWDHPPFHTWELSKALIPKTLSHFRFFPSRVFSTGAIVMGEFWQYVLSFRLDLLS